MKNRPIVQKHWGDWNIENRLWGGWRITGPLGEEVMIEADGRVSRLHGGGETYKRVVLFCREVYGGKVYVHGSTDDLLAFMQWGNRLQIPVIPKVGETSGCALFVVACFIAMFGFIVTIPFASSEASCVVGIIAGAIGFDLMKRASKRDALRFGQELRNKFPEVIGSSEKDEELDWRKWI